VTELLFREDSYLQSCDALINSVNEHGDILLDCTVFYATAGGQPGAKGTLTFNGQSMPIATTVYDEAKNVVHIPAAAYVLPEPETPVTLSLDWNDRYRNMRVHTLMHLLCASVPFPVTGGAITEDGGRIDFDIPEGQIPRKEELGEKINALIQENHAVSFRWISDDELAANPQLIRTMSVKPPTGTGKVRLVAIGENGRIDLQPCGGTHVRSTGEIGPIAVAKIENKGKMNRRIRLAFA
jgi:misacylated tRNA(Ala) deacylase